MRNTIHALLPTAECKLSIYRGLRSEPEFWRTGETDHGAVITLAPPPADALDRVAWREIDATHRCEWPDGARSLCVVAPASCSSLSPLLLWDLAHACPVGGTIAIVDQPSLLAELTLRRLYFENWLEEEDTGHRLVARFVKRRAAPVESDRGLTDWSFCIPVDRPSIADLTTIVRRIARMGFARWEVLIACPNEQAGALPDGVRHLSVAPGTTLTAKKNALAKAAVHPNLCIFHDRVVLPSNLSAAVLRFGDYFPMVGLQNLYVSAEDMTISRYSDYHVETTSSLNLITSVDADGAPNLALYGEALEMRQSWRSSFVEASIHEYDQRCYLTGSLYITKRSVWNLCGQDERIDWGGLEDVEFGHRAIAEFGIPSRVNPFAFARTNRIRPILSEGVHFHVADSWYNHEQRASRLGGSHPHEEAVFANTAFDYRERLLSFCKSWVAPFQQAEVVRAIGFLDANDPQEMIKGIVALLYLCVVRRDERELRAFLTDFSSKVLMTRIDRAAETEIVANVMRGEFVIDELVRSAYFRNMVVLAHKRQMFGDSERSASELLMARLLEIRRSAASGIAYPGAFDEFLAAVNAALD